MHSTWKTISLFLGATVLAASISQVSAGELTDRIAGGKSIRIGFAYEEPYAYPDGNGKPAGFVNAYTIGLLHQMGYENVEPVVMDWGGLIPALQSDRVDLITGGLYILKARCDSVKFSEPMAKVTNGFIVQPGNPKGLTNYRDIAAKGATMVTGVGYSPIIDGAKKDGVPESKIMQVPGPSEILAAVLAGRADVGVAGYPTARDLANKSGDKVIVPDPGALPESQQAWVGVAFRDGDTDFRDKFNEAQKTYLGTPSMMKAVAQYGYDEKMLPGDKTTEWVCANR
ncbi:transporter substrate-binding domain-containing protein [Mesorhizobium sp. M1121]|uniref:transporter substrate-binding domain-containing protein n=1 Tax=Mesorhizobium sp. M1121 TaxID=2957058 RepID=UPI0033350667